MVYLDHKLHALLLELTCSVLTHMKAVKSCILMPMGLSVIKMRMWFSGSRQFTVLETTLLPPTTYLHEDRGSTFHQMLVPTSKNKYCHNQDSHNERYPHSVSPARQQNHVTFFIFFLLEKWTSQSIRE